MLFSVLQLIFQKIYTYSNESMAASFISLFIIGTSAVKFLLMLLPVNMGFVNCSGLKFSPDFQHTQKQAL